MLPCRMSQAYFSCSSPRLSLNEHSKSIRQTRGTLPDFRSLGVFTRILLAANAVGAIAATFGADGIEDFPDRFARIAMVLEPSLLGTLGVLYIGSRLIARLPYTTGLGVVLLLAAVFSAAVAAAMAAVSAPFGQAAPIGDALWSACYALLLTGALAYYFALRERAFSPALAEARLQALQARIRPHFLFNCLNAVLVLVRRDPQGAEAALEDMADLFRSVMADARKLVPLADEIALTRQYLALETLRLGDRLKIEWALEDAVLDVLMPPMLLQPLVENAVYHGVEPGLDPGLIEIRARRSGDSMELTLSNPYHPGHEHRQGNRIALANIEERLALHFDVEAALETEISQERFRILIRVPFRKTR